MQQLIQRFLRYTLVLLPYTVDGQKEYRCNLLNPLSWVALILFGNFKNDMVTAVFESPIKQIKQL